MIKINVGHTKIAYTESGSGAPLLFIHGFAEDHRIWSKVIPSLEKTNRVICIDVPGSGKSGSIDSDATIDSIADTIHLFLKALQINKCSILGHSMGGYIALALLEKYPDCFSSMALIHSTSYADDENKKQTREKAIHFMNKNGSKSFLKTAIPDLYMNQSIHKSDIDEHIEIGGATDVSQLQQYYRAMIQRPDRSDILRKTNIPVLFVCGMHDKAVPLHQSLQQIYLAKESHVHILKHSAHMGMIEEPNILSDIIQNFIQQITTSIL